MFELIYGILNKIFLPITQFSPHISLLLLALIITLFTTLLNRLVTNRKLVKELNEKIKKIKDELKEAEKEKNREKVSKIWKEFADASQEQMKQLFKGFIVSLAVIALFLPWISYKYGGTTISIMPLSFFFGNLSWIWWYVLVALTVSIIFQKLFGI